MLGKQCGGTILRRLGRGIEFKGCEAGKDE
jgi:hypothetical protein